MKKQNKKPLLSSFEEMLMWTSYRYCIGRRSYVTCMADDIGVNFYKRMSDNQKQFATIDIRRTIYDQLRFLPFDFTIQWPDGKNFDPIKVLMNFISQYNIKSEDELRHFSKIYYNSYDNTYEFVKCEPNLKSYFNINDINDLLLWDKLASLFDIKNHKKVTLTNGETIEAFYRWTKNYIPIDDVYYKDAEFGWHQELIPLETYLSGKTNVYITPSVVAKIEDYNE